MTSFRELLGDGEEICNALSTVLGGWVHGSSGSALA
jgi:hypothetical protein